MKLLFWLCISTVVYAYFGYVLWLLVLSRVRNRPVTRKRFTPSVSVVIAARNEERNVPARLENLLRLDYPKERLQIVIVSDGSTDRTAKILEEQFPHIVPVILAESNGKAFALNEAIKCVTGEILVFMDARQSVEPNAITELVSCFADAAIGAVSGELVIDAESTVNSTGALGIYWRLEKLVRRLESASGSVVGVTGAIYAIRRELYTEIPQGTILDDVLVPMRIVRLGKRVVFQPSAIAHDLQLGKLRFTQKRFPEGVSLLEHALQYDPNSFEALRLLVGYDLFQKHPDKAFARLNAQIVKSPSNSGFYDLLAQLQIQNKNLEQAAATAQKAIQLNSGDGEAVMLFAQIKVQRGQVANAIGAWEQWQNTHPNDAGAMAILGTLEESRGDVGKAEAYYKKSLQIQPQQPIAANNLAYRMLQNGENVDVALTLAQTARRAMPDSPSTADTLAWAYYCKGTYVFARDLLEEAVKTEPTNPTMQYHLGLVYSKLADKNSAVIHLKKAITLAPESSSAKDAKTALEGMG